MLSVEVSWTVSADFSTSDPLLHCTGHGWVAVSIIWVLVALPLRFGSVASVAITILLYSQGSVVNVSMGYAVDVALRALGENICRILAQRYLADNYYIWSGRVSKSIRFYKIDDHRPPPR